MSAAFIPLSYKTPSCTLSFSRQEEVLNPTALTNQHHPPPSAAPLTTYLLLSTLGAAFWLACTAILNCFNIITWASVQNLSGPTCTVLNSPAPFWRGTLYTCTPKHTMQGQPRKWWLEESCHSTVRKHWRTYLIHIHLPQLFPNTYTLKFRRKPAAVHRDSPDSRPLLSVHCSAYV